MMSYHRDFPEEMSHQIAIVYLLIKFTYEVYLQYLLIKFVVKDLRPNVYNIRASGTAMP